MSAGHQPPTLIRAPVPESGCDDIYVIGTCIYNTSSNLGDVPLAVNHVAAVVRHRYGVAFINH